MIGYVTLGTNDIERAAQFYDQLLSELGAKRFMDTETFIAWVASPKGCAVCPSPSRSTEKLRPWATG